MLLDWLIDRFVEITKIDVSELLNDILKDKDIQQFIIDLNTKKQMYEEGVLSDNTVIYSKEKKRSQYTPKSYQFKINKFGSFPKHYALFETGEFYDSFKITLSRDSFYIDANPNKPDTNIFEEYGENVLGLTDDSLDQLREKLLPLMQEAIDIHIHEILVQNN